jgi:hypothetical protein
VASDTEQIDAELVHNRRYLADRLGRVGMEEDSALACHGPDLGNRLDGADFVVCVHDADEHGTRRDGAAYVAWINPARTVDR